MVDLLNFPLPPTFTGNTWDGLTWTVDSVEAGDTEYAAVLVSARFQLQTEDGTVALTRTSATAGQVTLNETSADSWSVTVEPVDLTLNPGTYTYGLETVDADGVTKIRMAGTFVVKPDPVKTV
jgi:hypothetical protein